MCKSRASQFLVNDLMVPRATDAVVLWDWAISLPREWRFVSFGQLVNISRSPIVEQVWRTHWTPVKVAYLFCRYLDILLSTSFSV